MRHKLYLLVDQGAVQSVGAICTEANREWHAQSIGPDHKKSMFVVMEPTQQLIDSLEQRHLAFPDLNDHTQTISTQHVGALQGTKAGETTYQTMKRIARDMPVMDPRG